MFTKKTISFLLIGTILNLGFFHTTGFAESKAEKHAAKVKAGIVRLGTGVESRVEVKLRDKTKVKGYVSEITEDSFTVVNEETNSRSTILYSQTKQVKGNNLSTGVKVAIAFGVFVAIAVVFALLNP